MSVFEKSAELVVEFRAKFLRRTVQEAKECFALLQYAIEAGDGNRQPADRSLSGLKAGERIVTLGAYQVRLAATAPAAIGHGHAH